jgi:FADH2 O2-dependent halogenase
VSADFDVAVVGSGFGGSLAAMIAQRLGYRTVLLERGRHPRFAIGESASPLAGVLIEQLADRYDLPRIRPLAAYGSWRRTYPDIVCGLKRGFTYFRHEREQAYRARPDRRNQLLVAASPNDELSDTHWLRSDVDSFLVREAIAVGVEFIDELHIETWNRCDAQSAIGGRRRGAPVSLQARFVVDASGPRGFVSRMLNVLNRRFSGYPPTQALFSHFTGVHRCADMPDFACAADSDRAATRSEGTPYPMDDAALHHMFDGGWMWVLRFGNGVTSAGIAVTDELASELRLGDGEPAWRRFLSLHPSIAAQFAAATPSREFTWMPRLPWCVERAAGDGWAMLPSAAAFVDPLFSTGIPLTLLGVERLARVMKEGLPAGRPLDEYADATLAEAEHTARFIAGCYAAFPRFEQFTAYSMFYFAAASYSEMARRLGVNSRGTRFLAADHPTFAKALADLSPQACGVGSSYAAAVARSIEPLNVAGLCDPRKRNWYAADLQDTVRGAAKLGVTAEQARALCIQPPTTNHQPLITNH